MWSRSSAQCLANSRSSIIAFGVGGAEGRAFLPRRVGESEIGPRSLGRLGEPRAVQPARAEGSGEATRQLCLICGFLWSGPDPDPVTCPCVGSGGSARFLR